MVSNVEPPVVSNVEPSNPISKGDSVLQISKFAQKGGVLLDK
jgi:hypothetical protein